MRALLVTGLIVTAACAASTGTAIDATVGMDFELHVGQSARLAADGIEVGFVAVVSDSRCGKGETCVWEGDAVVHIDVRQAGGDPQQLELHTAARETNAVSFSDYSIRLVALFPLPIANRQTSAEAYLATLRVDRGGVGDSTQYQ